jgi:stage III sporulation protein AD
MDITKIVTLSMFSLFVIILTKRFNTDCAFYISCIVSISITVFSLAVIIPVFDYVKELERDIPYSGFSHILFKSAGVCLLCSTAGDMCRDCGESSTASKIELAGKCTLITFSLPLIKTVFEYAKTFIS